MSSPTVNISIMSGNHKPIPVRVAKGFRPTSWMRVRRSDIRFSPYPAAGELSDELSDELSEGDERVGTCSNSWAVALLPSVALVMR